MWVKVTFGKLSNGKCHDSYTRDDYYVRAQSWHTNVKLPVDNAKAKGCCTAVETHKDKWFPKSGYEFSHWKGWSRVYKCSADFEGRSIMIPYEKAVTTGVLVELWEDDGYFGDDFAGRVYLDFKDADSRMKTYTLTHGAQLEARLEILQNDAGAVQSALGPEPQCKWLLQHLDKSQKWMCGQDQGWKVVNHFLKFVNVANANTCEAFYKDITTGI